MEYVYIHINLYICSHVLLYTSNVQLCLLQYEMIHHENTFMYVYQALVVIDLIFED